MDTLKNNNQKEILQNKNTITERMLINGLDIAEERTCVLDEMSMDTSRVEIKEKRMKKTE